MLLLLLLLLLLFITIICLVSIFIMATNINVNMNITSMFISSRKPLHLSLPSGVQLLSVEVLKRQVHDAWRGMNLTTLSAAAWTYPRLKDS